MRKGLSICLIQIQIALQKDLFCLRVVCFMKALIIDFAAYNQHSLSELYVKTTLNWTSRQLPLELMFSWRFYSEPLFPIVCSFTVLSPNRVKFSQLKGDFSLEGQATIIQLLLKQKEKWKQERLPCIKSAVVILELVQAKYFFFFKASTGTCRINFFSTEEAYNHFCVPTNQTNMSKKRNFDLNVLRISGISNNVCNLSDSLRCKYNKLLAHIALFFLIYSPINHVEFYLGTTWCISNLFVFSICIQYFYSIILSSFYIHTVFLLLYQRCILL